MQDVFQQYLDEVKALTRGSGVGAPSSSNTPQKQKNDLVSEFDIRSRPGMRSTKVSQKLRQEKDRANMTTEDAEYTKLMESFNELLKETFAYALYTSQSLCTGILFRKMIYRYTKSFTLTSLKYIQMYHPR